MELGSVWLPDLRIVVWRGYSVKLGISWRAREDADGENLNTALAGYRLNRHALLGIVGVAQSNPA